MNDVRWATEILGDYGISVQSTVPGRYYAICPNCSHKRKPAHRKLKILAVTINDDGVMWYCIHCHWKGGEFYKPRKGNSGGRKNDGGSPFVAEYIYKQADGCPYLKVCKT